jgi:CheY-like chemotaxis protein
MKSKCVLVAEDDENDVLFLQRAFRQAEITTPLQVTRDGQDAIDYLAGSGRYTDREQFPLPCLVMLDLKMPRKNGMETLAWIRGQEALEAMPVIIFSSSLHPEEIDKAYRLGASAFLTKPSGVKERLELAKRIKRSWLGLIATMVGLGAGLGR